MNSESYWAIDSKSSILEQSGSIDPSFNQQTRDEQDQQTAAVAAAVVASQHHHHLHPQPLTQDSPQGIMESPTEQDNESELASHLDMSVTTNSPPGTSSQASEQTSPTSPQMHHGRMLSNTKRAHQNRQAQRAFRQRKEMYIKELEAKVHELKASKETISALRQENIQLRDYILALQSRLIEHPGGVPTPPAVCARQPSELYDGKLEK